MSDTVEVVVKVTDNASGPLSSIGGSIQKLGGFALGGLAVGLGAAAAGVGALASAAIGGNAQFEQYNTQFEVMLGSAEAAQERMAELAEFGASTPFELPQVVEADRILQGFGLHAEETAEKFGFSGEQIRTIAGDVASGTGANFQEMALLIGKFSAGATGEAISRMAELGIASRAELAGLGLEFDKAGSLLYPLPEAMEVVLQLMNDKYGGMMDAQSQTFNGMLSNLQDWKDATIRRMGEPIFDLAKEQLQGLLSFINSPEVVAAMDNFAIVMAESIGKFIDWVVNVGIPGFQNFMTILIDLGTRVLEFLQPVLDAVAGFVSWQDVLAALGIAIAAVVLPALYGLITAIAPIIAAFVGLVAIVSILRNAWENDWGGIRTAIMQFWEETARPALEQLQQWLMVNVPIALETLRAWWVDTAWPAIQVALEVAWTIISFILAAMWDSLINVIIPALVALWDYWVNVAWPAIRQALADAWAFMQPILVQVVDYVMTVIIPTVQDLYEKWTTVWWPTIQTVLQNTWTAIVVIFQELDRWINTNIIPWIQFLHDKWVDEWWPAISAAITKMWGIIEPILVLMEEWFVTKITNDLNALKTLWDTIWGGMTPIVDTVKGAIEGLVSAVTAFWDFISSHTFDFHVNIPDLPDWALPGSPLPIHTAWKDFNEYMQTVRPLGDGMGGGRQDTYNKSMTINTNIFTSGIGLDSDDVIKRRFAYGGI